MRVVFCILLLITTKVSFSQSPVSFSEIDERVRLIEASGPDSLSKLLAKPYTTDLQKVRAIYSWIAQHISYNTFVISSSRRFASTRYVPEPDDTSFVWKPAIEMTAIKVLKKRTAVCDGYAKLFKTLCDYTGIRAEIISGYARGYTEGENKFRSNHSWNAVMIDSAWKLLDVTWGSGYINYANQFVQHLEDTYFLTPPQQFFADHYPEDLQWALMDNPPAIREFRRTPFKGKSFVKYGINSFLPSNGIIETAVGDTIRIEVNMKDVKRDKTISPDPFFDSSSINHAFSLFLSPSDTLGNKFIYTYKVASPSVDWVNIVYNSDVIIRYKLSIKKEQEIKPEDQ